MPVTVDLPASVQAALVPLPNGYLGLTARIAAWVRADDRVRALWLGGSLGRGEPDAGSDLDVLLAVRDERFDEFWAEWPRWLAAWTPTIIARPLPGLGGCLYSVTPDCERLDVVAEPVGQLAESAYRSRLIVVDKDQLDALVPAVTTAPGPDPERVAAIVEEFLRQQALFAAAVVAREDWLLGVVGVGQTQQLLYRLFVETNQPLPPMGVKQWSRRLDDRQRDVLARLPGPDATRPSVLTAMRAARDAMLFDGRRAAERVGVRWPTAVDEAVARSIEPVLPPRT